MTYAFLSTDLRVFQTRVLQIALKNGNVSELTDTGSVLYAGLDSVCLFNQYWGFPQRAGAAVPRQNRPKEWENGTRIAGPDCDHQDGK
ncbi:MAG: hypothetical protein ACKPJJ_11000, partial [Planctomycetaceae bacterium]